MNDIAQLLLNPTETRSMELKTWLVLTDREHEIKIAQALLALHNENGGHLIIGFDDKTNQPNLDRPTGEIRTIYHQDKIQGIVSNHASPRFEVRVEFPEHDGLEYPVITVSSGVVTPVLVQSDVYDSTNKKVKLQAHTLLARSLDGNGRMSVIPARPNDLERIMKHCMENREADFAKTLSRMLTMQERSLLAQRAAPELTAQRRNPSLSLLERGHTRFIEAAKKDPKYQPNVFGTWEVAAQITPPLTGFLANKDFLNTVMSQNPSWTGWPMWIDIRRNNSDGPNTTNGVWEAWVNYFDFKDETVSNQKNFGINHFDFWCIEPHGGFYQLQALEDDSYPDRVKPKTVLDWRLMSLRVAESISTTLAFAQGLNANERTIEYAFRWQGLNNRQLKAWADHPGIHRHVGGKVANDDVVTVQVELPTDAAINQVITVTHQVMQQLLIVFAGESMKREQVQFDVENLIKR
jgi:hypothetical protein